MPAAAPAQATAGSDAALATVRATTAAALSKELLKLGNSKLEKAIDKEYVKIFATLALETWIDNFDVSHSSCDTIEAHKVLSFIIYLDKSSLQVASVERVVDTITVCSTHDRATNKNLELLMQICITQDMHTPSNGIKCVTHYTLSKTLRDVSLTFVILLYLEAPRSLCILLLASRI